MFVLFAVAPLSISGAAKNRSAMQLPGYKAVRVHYGPLNKMIMSVRINGHPADLLVHYEHSLLQSTTESR